MLSFAVHAQPLRNSQGVLAALAASIPSHPSYVVHFSRHFSWGKFGCTFSVSDGEQCIFYLIYYTVSPSSCSLVAELQVNKMIAITESPVVCAALDFSIMSHHYDLGEACFA